MSNKQKKYKEPSIVVPRFNEENGFYTTPQRSRMMGKIRSKNTKPEMKLRKVLWDMGLRYRKNVKKLPGSPDIVLGKYKLVIFVDGEFWHGHNWEEKKNTIKTNRRFWIPKIERNMQRDRQNNDLLVEKGWHVMRFWENDIKKNFGAVVNAVLRYIEKY
ncbi:very short patch repair endonuclease [Cytophagaceae bacterium ABcell3]|nr:very short patch repair endonuclease [Cytophagaceae bacterium ABcell3]